MLPRLVKTENLAPVRADRKTLHEIACKYGEEQFKLKGGMASMWIVASGPNVAWVETDWHNNHDKDVANYAMRELLEGTAAQAYSFITEAWTASFAADKNLSEAESKHWMEFANKHGVRELPPHLRDDVLVVLSFDRKGGCSNTKYIVQMRHGKGLDYLGPRIDEESEDGMHWAGRLGNLLLPEKSVEDARKAAAVTAAAMARSAKS